MIENVITGIQFYHKQTNNTAQKMKFSIKDFFSKCDQIRRKFVLNHAKHHICSEEQTFAGVQRWEIPKFCPLSS